MFDLVIRGGRVVDGTGASSFEADVAIEGDRIVEVGSGLGAGRRELDASGKLVTPGFVDMHTHYDAQVSWDPYLTPSTWHGCTTVVMGSCGVGFAPAAPDRHEWLIGLMEGVEDIPGAAMTEGIQWGWESYPEYLSAIEARPHAIDFGAQVPHGAVRAYVMGERGANNEPATPADVEAMARIVREAIRAGALGFSTSRTMIHKSKDGVPVPGTFADRDELFGIGRALQAEGAGVFQMAGDHHAMLEELSWIRALAREIGRPVMFNLSQFDQAPELWRRVAAELTAAGEAGEPVFAQVAGRAIGIIMGFELTAHPFATYPTFQALLGLSREERAKRLRDPQVRARILADTPLNLGEFETFVTTTFDKMFAMKGGVNYEPTAEDSVASIARREGRTPQEVAYDLMLEDVGAGTLYFPLFNYSHGDLEVVRELHQHPRTLLGLSDAGAHCGAICDGGMPTFMLTHWARDRSRGERFGLEFMVHRQTQQTARAFGLLDRGVLKPGYRADVNVIDYEKLGFGRPEVVYDLPAGGRRLAQRGKGYVATICRGQPIVEHDEFTGALPGQLLRGTQAAPAPVHA